MKLTKKSNKYLATAKIIVLSLILSAGISIVYGWTGPTAAPFGGNTPPPMNLGVSSQTKLGFGWFAGLGSTLGAFINGTLETAGFRFSGTSPAAGKILKATDVQGNATWATPGLACVPRTVTGLLGDAQSACQSEEVLTGGGGSCQINILSSAPNPADPNEWFVFCSGSSEAASATAICCTMNFVTAI